MVSCIIVIFMINFVMIKKVLSLDNIAKVINWVKSLFNPKEIGKDDSTNIIKYVKDKINVDADTSKPYPCNGSKLPQFGCVLERSDGLNLCDSLPTCIGYLEPNSTLKGLATLAGLNDPIGLLGSEPVLATDSIRSGTFYRKK